jgi:hypothetical protein
MDGFMLADRFRLATALTLTGLILARASFAQKTSTIQVAADAGEPLPAGAPTQPYELSAWCYGAMSEYLAVYDEVKPDLRAIDKQWGSSVPNEKEPYQSDMAAARGELKVLAGAVEAAERASPQVIAPRGIDAVRQGRGIWGPAESHTRRELARAWMSWALPDRCDSNARELTSKSALLGQVLKYNAPSATDAPADPPPSPPATPVSDPAPAPDASPAQPATPPPSGAGIAADPTPAATHTDPAVPPYPVSPLTHSPFPPPAGPHPAGQP